MHHHRGRWNLIKRKELDECEEMVEWNLWQDKPEKLRKTYSNSVSSTTKPTYRTDARAQDAGGWRRVSYRLRHGAAHSFIDKEKLSFQQFSTLISFVSFHFIRPCDVATDMVGRNPCYSLTFNIGTLTYLIPQPGPVSDRNWGGDKEN